MGTAALPIVICGEAFTWLVQGVKRVTEDLSGAMFIRFAHAQSATGAKASERSEETVEASREMSGCETATVTSSA